MARRIVHQLVDDIDGTVLEPGSGETVLFSVDGVAYEIDLAQDNAATFREALSRYIDAARRVSGRSSSGDTGSDRRRRTGQQDYGPIRTWAKENGHKVSERGRVSASVIEAYEAAH